MPHAIVPRCHITLLDYRTSHITRRSQVLFFLGGAAISAIFGFASHDPVSLILSCYTRHSRVVSFGLQLAFQGLLILGRNTRSKGQPIWFSPYERRVIHFGMKPTMFTGSTTRFKVKLVKVNTQFKIYEPWEAAHAFLIHFWLIFHIQ